MYDHLAPSQMHIRYIKVGRHSSYKKNNVYIADTEHAPLSVQMQGNKKPCHALIASLMVESSSNGREKNNKINSRQKVSLNLIFFSLFQICECWGK